MLAQQLHQVAYQVEILILNLVKTALMVEGVVTVLESRDLLI